MQQQSYTLLNCMNIELQKQETLSNGMTCIAMSISHLYVYACMGYKLHAQRVIEHEGGAQVLYDML